MKKTSGKKMPIREGKSSREQSVSSKKRAKARPARQPPQILDQATSLLRRAHALYGQVEKAHFKAYELHRSAEQVHHSVWKTESIPLISGELADIVTDEHQRPKAPFPIVGIGASAGGYEAFTEFLSALPRDLGMAFVLVQ